MELKACMLPSPETPITSALITRSAYTTKISQVRILTFLRYGPSSRFRRVSSEFVHVPPRWAYLSSITNWSELPSALLTVQVEGLVSES